MRNRRWSCFAAPTAALALAVLAVSAALTAAESATQPSPRNGEWWTARHQAISERVKQGDVDLIFIGDSITQGWEGNGRELWQEYYGSRKAVNLGISGDRTQHVLWRLENGSLEGISPKLAVVMIGTNNSGDDTPEEIAEGVKLIVEKLRTKLPQTKVLLLATFPRGPNPQDPRRQVNEKSNEIVSKLADGQMVLYLDIGKNFLQPDGTLSREIMPDLLHLSPQGYQVWAESIEPVMAEVLGPKQ
jgi:beta-glucosidase